MRDQHSTFKIQHSHPPSVAASFQAPSPSKAHPSSLLRVFAPSRETQIQLHHSTFPPPSVAASFQAPSPSKNPRPPWRRRPRLPAHLISEKAPFIALDKPKPEKSPSRRDDGSPCLSPSSMLTQSRRPRLRPSGPPRMRSCPKRLQAFTVFLSSPLLTRSRLTASRPAGTSLSLLTRSRPTASRPAGTSHALLSKRLTSLQPFCPNGLQAFSRFHPSPFKSLPTIA